MFSIKIFSLFYIYIGSAASYNLKVIIKYYFSDFLQNKKIEFSLENLKKKKKNKKIFLN